MLLGGVRGGVSFLQGCALHAVWDLGFLGQLCVWLLFVFFGAGLGEIEGLVLRDEGCRV